MCKHAHEELKKQAQVEVKRTLETLTHLKWNVLYIWKIRKWSKGQCKLSILKAQILKIS